MTNQKSLNDQMWTIIRGQSLDTFNEGTLKDLTKVLESGANPNALRIEHGSNKVTPLSYITRHINKTSSNFKIQEKLISLLINKGANVNAKETLLKHTPLMNAVSKDAITIVKLLISKGADVNERLKLEPGHLVWDIRTSVDFAKTPEMLKFLLEHGADPNKSKNGNGNTPLHNLCEDIYRYPKNAKNYIKMIKMLLEHGEDPNEYNLKLYTPMMIICGAQPVNDPSAVSSETKLEVIKLLFEHGADMNKQSQAYGITAIGFAAKSEDWNVVKTMAYNGANIYKNAVPVIRNEDQSERIWQNLKQIIRDLYELEKQDETSKTQNTWKTLPTQKTAGLRRGQKVVKALNKMKEETVVESGKDSAKKR